MAKSVFLLARYVLSLRFSFIASCPNLYEEKSVFGTDDIVVGVVIGFGAVTPHTGILALGADCCCMAFAVAIGQPLTTTPPVL